MDNIPVATRNLLIVNCVVLLAQYVLNMRGIDLTALFGLHFMLAKDFHIWQLFTYMFLHADITHLFFNMFALWMFGVVIERTLGLQRFLIYYFVCGIGAGICQELWQFAQYYWEGMANYSQVSLGNGTVMDMAAFLNEWTTIGASGACYGVLLAFGYLYPNERIMLLIPPIPMKAKYFVVAYAAIELFSAFSSNSNIAHFAHLGGMLFGFILLVRWKRRGWPQPYSRKMGNSLWNKLKKKFQRMDGYEVPDDTPVGSYNADVDYNRRQKEREARVDRILDKIKESGYESLTKEEKEELFNDTRNY